MAKTSAPKKIPIRPLTGLLDNRSLPELMAPASWRLRQNFAAPEDLKMCRRDGFEKLLTKEEYNNEDLHDQLLILQQYYSENVPASAGSENVTVYPSGLCDALLERTAGRERITFLFESVSSTGARRLLAGTQSRVYELNETTGNWRILGDGYGGVADPSLSVRWYAAQVKDTVVLTNNFDVPQAYVLAAPLQGCAMRAMTAMPDLATIFLTKAAVVASFKNSIFFGNVEMDGQRLENRIIWSDANAPTSFDPVNEITGVIFSQLTGNVLSWTNPSGESFIVQSRAATTDPWVNVRIVTTESLIVADTSLEYRVATFTTSSITGYFDLDYGHKILAIVTLGNYLCVLTNLGIWQGQPTGLSPDQGPAYSFRQTYFSADGANCLIYRNTLISTGDELYYLSRDGIYVYNFYRVAPERPEWLHKATGIIYTGLTGNGRINELCCDSHVACYRPVEKEYWISWAVEGTCVPEQTIVANLRDKYVDTVDHGFTAFEIYRSDQRGTLRDFLLNYCICTPDTLVENGITFEKEGLPLDDPTPDCLIVPTVIYTHETIPVDPDDPGGQQMEDYDAAEAAEDSICAALAGLTIDDLCRDCNQKQLFVAASSTDWCLKQMGGAYYREMCSNPTAVGVVFVDANGLYTYQSSPGVYTQDGYYSVIRSAPLDYGLDSVLKELTRLLVGYEAAQQAYPCVLQLRLGVGYSAVEPTAGRVVDPNNSQNNADCGVVWQTILRKLLICQNDRTPAQYAATNTVPNLGMEWATLNKARYFYIEIVIASLTTHGVITSALVPAIGGASCFSSVEATVKACAS